MKKSTLVTLGAVVAAAAAMLVFAGVGMTTSGSPDRVSKASLPSLAAHTASNAAVVKANVVYSAGRSSERWTEWVDMRNGAWRLQAPGITKIYSEHHYVVVRGETGTYIRTGSPSFIGYLSEAAVSPPAISRYLGTRRTLAVGTKVARLGPHLFEVTRGGAEFRVSIIGRVSRKHAQELRLFSTPTRRVTSRASQRQVGATPKLQVRAYWFGPNALGRNPVTAVEFSHRRTPEQIAAGITPRKDADACVAFYERPAAAGASSALPGQTPPEGELQVVSQPVDSATARGAIDAFNGTNGDVTYPAWPRFEIALRNSERVTVVPDLVDGGPTAVNPFYNSFSVITPTTLVSVIGNVTLTDLQTLAAQLTPIR